jgi:hypothetical protein
MTARRLLQRLFQIDINLRGAVSVWFRPSSRAVLEPSGIRTALEPPASRTLKSPGYFALAADLKAKKALADKRPGLSNISTSKTILKIDVILSPPTDATARDSGANVVTCIRSHVPKRNKTGILSRTNYAVDFIG